jgi:CDP-6-deoxy-D-xylo-4-hexulose-3-dehydrase
MIMSESEIRASIKELIESYSDNYLLTPFDPVNPVVKLHEPTFGADEILEALDSMLTTQVTMGEKVRRFEREFGEYHGFANSMMVNSGSSANLLAIAALTNPTYPDRLLHGDEVIVPALSWSTTIWPLVQHGLVPVFVDVDPGTLNIDPSEIERAVSDKTRAVMLVHVYGNPCDMTSIVDIVNRHNLLLIEDCCEALGATYGGKPVGSFGHVGTFSFYFSHHMTTLEGGMCVTDDHDSAELIRVLRAHGWVRETEDRKSILKEHPGFDPKFLFVNVGYNLRATELQGGFGYHQLGKLQGFVDVRTDNAKYWRKELGGLGDFFDFQEETADGVHSWFGYPMAVKEEAAFNSTELCDFLNQYNIETRPIVAGNITKQPALQYYDYRVVGDLAHCDYVMRNGFTFGNHQAVNHPAREYIFETVKSFLVKRGLL